MKLFKNPNIWCKDITEYNISNFVFYFNIILIIIFTIIGLYVLLLNIKISLSKFKEYIMKISDYIHKNCYNIINNHQKIFLSLAIFLTILIFTLVIILPLYLTNILPMKYNYDDIHEIPYNNNAPSEYKNLLSTHNKYRAMHQANPLLWDTNLANESANIAKNLNYTISSKGINNGECSSGCYLIPVSTYNLNNLINTISDYWYKNIINYNFSKPESNTNSEVITANNMLWKSATKIGCATSNSKNYKSIGYIVCKYDVDNGTNENNINNISNKQKCLNLNK